MAHVLLDLFGVPIADSSIEEGMELLLRWIEERPARCRSVYFVNTHTLNVACANVAYKDVLRRGDVVFGDGTGARWAARMLHGVRLKANVNGNDLVEPFLDRTGGRGYRLFLLGARPEAIERAARHVRERFAGWALAGYHHGYLDAAGDVRVIEVLNRARPDMLLVGMGNPRQEEWIDRYRDRLEVPVGVAVGGLFDYWSGELSRAPGWMRALGMEWVNLLVRQPHKAARYLVGNPRFVARLARVRWQERGR